MSASLAAALFADSPEFEQVFGFQRDSPSSGYKVAMLNRGESPLKGEEPGLEELLKKSRGSRKIPVHVRLFKDRSSSMQ